MAIWTGRIHVHGDGVTHHNQRPNIYVQVQINSFERSGGNLVGNVTASLDALDYSTSYFGYPLGIGISIDNGDMEPIFNKPASPSQWNSGTYKGTKTVTAANTTNRATLKVWFYATCECSGDSTWERTTVDGKTYYVVAQSEIGPEYVPPATYTVTWKNYDGTTLETDTNVPYGTTPTYDGATPTHPSTTDHTYTFSWWSPSVSAIIKDTTYIATFSASKIVPADGTGELVFILSHGYYSGQFNGQMYIQASEIRVPLIFSPTSSSTVSHTDYEDCTVTMCPNNSNIHPNAGWQIDNSRRWSEGWANQSFSITISYDDLDTNNEYKVYAMWEYCVYIYPNGGRLTELIDTANAVDKSSYYEIWTPEGYSCDVQVHAYKLGHIATGFSESSDSPKLSGSSSELPRDEGGNVIHDTDLRIVKYRYTGNVPEELYVFYVPLTFTVTFKDGYSKNGEDVLRVVSGVPYETDMTDPNNSFYSQVPVAGTDIGSPYNRTFQRLGPYGFIGWSAPINNICSDMVVVALWEFAPIWIVVEDAHGVHKWVPYKPNEEAEEGT